MAAIGERSSRSKFAVAVLLTLSSVFSSSLGYQQGEIIPMSKMGQYHCSRTIWQDMIGRNCPIFGVNREVLVRIAEPTSYTGADPYKISFEVGREKFETPWMFLINRKSPEVPMIHMHLSYGGGDLLGVTAEVVDMPQRYVDTYPNILDQYWDPHHWPKYVIARYTWEEHSDDIVEDVITATAGLIKFVTQGINAAAAAAVMKKIGDN